MTKNNAMVQLYPEIFARFYDVIYHQQRDGVDNEFYLQEIKKTKGKILEVGVGTGRLFTEALNQGADIYGLDISPAMVEVLSGKLKKEQLSRVSLQNIIDFSSDLKFDLVIAPFRVMMHLQEKEQQLQALNNVCNHLNENGRFIFDAFVPDLKYLIHGFENHTDFEGEYEPGKKVKRIVNTNPDLINQIIEVHFTLEWEEDSERKREEWIMPMRFYFRYELEHLIERSAFRRYEIFGDFHESRLNQNSKEFIVVCYK